jgi:hypothetical protein
METTVSINTAPPMAPAIHPERAELLSQLLFMAKLLCTETATKPDDATLRLAALTKALGFPTDL